MKRLGFTLIEILVVIVVLSVIFGFVSISYGQSQKKARDTKRKDDLKSVQQALELYYQTNGKYPGLAIPITGKIKCNSTGDSNTISWGTAFTCTPTTNITYMNKLPMDPEGPPAGKEYFYYVVDARTSYTLSAKLENASDTDLNDLTCVPWTDYNYCVEP